jgi:hypothetical protein
MAGGSLNLGDGLTLTFDEARRATGRLWGENDIFYGQLAIAEG